MSREMLNANAYITFTYRDPCPNAVVEAQSYGLPVVALRSGGVTEIVKHGGELIHIDDFPNGYLWSNLNNKDYPKIDAQEAYLSLKKVIKSLPKYQERARSNFLDNLEISKVSEQYLKLLKRF
jgi:glycosyltransferase involved in cell wall biosynthesis